MFVIIKYFFFLLFIHCTMRGKGNDDSLLDDDIISNNTRINFCNFKKKYKKKDKNILDIENEEFLNKKNIKNLSPEKASSVLEKIKKNSIKINLDLLNVLKEKYLYSIINYSGAKLYAKNYIQKKSTKFKKESIKKIKNKKEFINFIKNIQNNDDIKLSYVFDKYIKEGFAFFGTEMENNRYTQYGKVYDKDSNFDKTSLVGLLQWAATTEDGYELLQKAIDLKLFSINDEYKSRGSKSIDAKTKYHNSLIETILTSGLNDSININDKYINVLKKLVNNNNFSLKNDQIGRIDDKLFKVAWQIYHAYQYSISCLKIFSKYLKNDSHSDELTDYKDVQITKSDLEKLKLFDNANNDFNILKKTLSNLYNNKEVNLKNNFNLLDMVYTYPERYFQDKNNKELPIEEIYQLKLKFIKYLLKHKLLNDGNLVGPVMLHKLMYFNSLSFFNKDKRPKYFSYKKKIIETLCKSRYYNKELKKVFYSNIVEPIEKDHINIIKESHCKVRGIYKLLNTKIKDEKDKFEFNHPL